jgi:hypothetical protein
MVWPTLGGAACAGETASAALIMTPADSIARHWRTVMRNADSFGSALASRKPQGPAAKAALQAA